MGYMVQLLLKSEEEARVLRDALAVIVMSKSEAVSESERDIAHAIYADLTNRMRRSQGGI